MSRPGYDTTFAERTAENYERYFVPAIGAHVAADLVDAAMPRPGERVLDVACGTGAVTRLVAKRVGPEGTVAGLDPNPGMLEVAREVSRGASPPAASIRWHQAPAEEIPLPDESFDLALCGMGLQFFSDRTAGLREIRRVLVPGGRLVAKVPGPTPPPFEIMAEELTRHVGPESGSFARAVFSLHDPDDLRTLTTGAGFEDVEVRVAPRTFSLPSPEAFLWQYVESTPLAAPVAAVGEERRAALERAFSERCRPFVEDGGLALEVDVATVLATK